MELARQNDDGFDPRMFADSLGRIQRYTDKQFAAYGLTAAEAASLRERFADWQRQLIAPQDGSPAGKRTAAATISPSLQQPVQRNTAANAKPPSPAPGSPGGSQPGDRPRR